MNLIASAYAENAVSVAVEGMTAEEAAVAGAAFGAVAGAAVVVGIIWFILQVIADWKIFTKAGKAGWKSLIPVYNTYVEYGLCWKGLYGLIVGVAALVANMIGTIDKVPTLGQVVVIAVAIVVAVLHAMESDKLSKAFGKGTAFGFVLFLFGPIGRLVLGFGKAKYVGKM